MSKLKLQVPEVTYDENTSRQRIAFEAQFIANAVELAKSYLPAIFSNFKTDIKQINLEQKDLIPLDKVQNKLITIIDQLNYVDIKDLELPVCSGFHSNLLVGFGVTEDIIKKMTELHTVIKDFHTYVAVFLTNKDAKKKTVDLTNNNKKIEAIIKSMKDSIATIFLDGSNDNTLTFSKLFTNNNEFKKAVREHNYLNKKIEDDIKIKEVKQLIEEIAEYLDSVMESLKQDKVDSLSPECVKSLSEGTYQVALAAEAFSMGYFKILGIMNIVPGFQNYITENLIRK